MNLKKRYTVLGIIHLVLVSLSGALIWTWLDLDTSLSVPATIWVLAWMLEYDLLSRFTRPSRSRDWIAHISGIGISMTGLFAWLYLTKSYHLLLQRAAQATYILLVLSAHIGIIYLLSSSKYRSIVRKWLLPRRR